MTRVSCSPLFPPPPENRPQVRVICNHFDLTFGNRTSRFNQSQYIQKEVFDRWVPTHPFLTLIGSRNRRIAMSVYRDNSVTP